MPDDEVRVPDERRRRGWRPRPGAALVRAFQRRFCFWGAHSGSSPEETAILSTVVWNQLSLNHPPCVRLRPTVRPSAPPRRNKLLLASGVKEGFLLRDLIKPDPLRTRTNISAIINYSYHRTDKLAGLEKFAEVSVSAACL